MKPSPRELDSRARVAFAPVILVALVWMGVQILLLIYLQTVLLVPAELGPSASEFIAEVLSGSSAPGAVLGLALLTVNVLLVSLIWLKYSSLQPQSRSARRAALVTYAGVTILLLLIQWTWIEFLRSALQ